MADLPGAGRGQPALEGDELVAPAGEAVGQRRPPGPQLVDQRVPPISTDRLRVPPVEGQVTGEAHAMKRRHGGAHHRRIHRRVGRVKVHPAVDPHRRVADDAAADPSVARRTDGAGTPKATAASWNSVVTM